MARYCGARKKAKTGGDHRCWKPRNHKGRHACWAPTCVVSWD